MEPTSLKPSQTNVHNSRTTGPLSLPARVTQPLRMTEQVLRVLNQIDDRKRRRRLKRQFWSVVLLALLWFGFQWSWLGLFTIKTVGCESTAPTQPNCALPQKQVVSEPVPQRQVLTQPVSQDPNVSWALQAQALRPEITLDPIQGVNYYPQHQPWKRFWPQYQGAVIEADFKRIQSMGFNTLRTFVFYEPFQSPATQKTSLVKLKDLLDRAQAHNLKVIVTLFDDFYNYSPASFPEVRAHLQKITTTMEEHPAILAWDLKNELDMALANTPRNTLESWLDTVINEIRLHTQKPVTVGFADPTRLSAQLSQKLDFVTFHYYQPEEHFLETVNKLRSYIPGKPLVLGEFGYHTWENSPTDPHPKEHQFNYYQSLLGQSVKAELEGILVWGLYDFSPQLKDNFMLKQLSPEYHLGLIDVQGQAKPGLNAFSQPVLMLDADTQKAVNPLTQKIEFVFQLAQPEKVQFRIKNGQTSIKTIEHVGKAGLNQLVVSIDSQSLTDLLNLKHTLHIKAEHLQDIKKTLIHWPESQPLVLRLK